MAFDWKYLLDSRSIEYRHTSRTQIEVKCPFCVDDPSYHLSISLEGKGWRCWRQPSLHVGRNPTKLVAALLHCTWEQARLITGSGIAPSEDLLSQISVLLSPPTDLVDASRGLEPLDGFHSFSISRISALPFYNYMKNRGFIDIKNFTRDYDLWFCNQGPFAGRIIFLLKFAGKVVNWTGRTIVNHPIRYKTLSTDPEKSKREGVPTAIKSIGHCLLWYDDLVAKEGNILYLCEGPFDALKLRTLGANATCFFTQTPSEVQSALLHELSRHYGKIILLLDQGTLPIAIDIASRLSSLNILVGELPSHIKDPALLNSLDLLRP